MEEFMQRIGLKDMANAGASPAIFDLQGLGQLTLAAEDDDDDFQMSLTVPLPPYEKERLLAALRQCHPDRARAFPLSCGLYRDHLIFISRQMNNGLTAAALENQAMFLIDNAKALGF
jgi:type III secretion system chaperone SycN